MKRAWRDYLADVLNSIQEVEDFTRGMEYEQFEVDKKTAYAVLRSLEVMGEAAKRIPETVRQRYQDIPWKRMTGMRDKLIHEYSGVDLEIVWAVVKTELPPLKPYIEQILRDLDAE